MTFTEFIMHTRAEKKMPLYLGIFFIRSRRSGPRCEPGPQEACKASLHTHSASMVEIFIVTSSSTSSSMRTVSREVSITTLFRAARRRKATPSP